MIIQKLKLLGPALLFAAAAIGASHLVQSTRAGMDYGLKLLPIVLLANIIKYPFFELGQRYVATTGKNLLEAYSEHSYCFVAIYIVLALLSSITTIAAVSFVSASLLAIMFPDAVSVAILQVIILLSCAAIIIIGHYRTLEFTIKLLLLVLALATITAVILSLFNIGTMAKHTSPIFTASTLAFIVALMGWMPAPMEASIWTSIWTQSNAESKKLPFFKKYTF